MRRVVMPAVIATWLGACGGAGGPVGPGSPSPPSVPTVGVAGGTVIAGGGAVRLVIPPGALATNVAFTIRAAQAVPSDPLAVPGSAWDLTPAVAFATPATLTVGYEPARVPIGVNESELRLFGVGAGNAWAPVGGSSVDSTANEVSGPITRTATFGVRAAR